MNYKLGTVVAIALCLSAIIGDTLFVFTGVPIAEVGTNSIIAYVIVGILAIIIAMQLGELSSINPNDKGGAYSYAKDSFGTELGFVTGMLLYFGYCAMLSGVALGFGEYFISLFGLGGIGLQIAISALLIVLISTVNMHGLKRAAELSKILIVITLLTIVAFFVFALIYGSGHNTLVSNFLNTTTQNSAAEFVEAITAIVFAYSGFQMITTLTDNIRGKGRGVAKVMVISLIISIIAYIAMTVGLMLLVPAAHTTINAEPFIVALSYVHAPALLSVLISIGILFAIAASEITIMFTASRLIYQIGNDGMLPKITRVFDTEKGVATTGVWISAAIAILVLFSGGIYTILSISNFGIIFSWLMGCLSVIHMRRRKKYGNFISPYYPYLTIVGIVACIVFLIGLPINGLEIGTIIFLFLLAVYYTAIEIKYRKKSGPRTRLFD